VSAPYVEGQAGRLRPVAVLDRCPVAGVGERCQLRKHGFRSRKTGPGFGLQRLHCELHGVYFTVYPPGYVPYARQAVAPVDERGQVVAPAEGAAAWRPTLFRRGAGSGSGRALGA
jgi:hypothetical protein